MMATMRQLLKLDGIFSVKIRNMLALMPFQSCVVSGVVVDNFMVLVKNGWVYDIWISCLKTSANVNGLAYCLNKETGRRVSSYFVIVISNLFLVI
jgi:hypothetical protein